MIGSLVNQYFQLLLTEVLVDGLLRELAAPPPPVEREEHGPLLILLWEEVTLCMILSSNCSLRIDKSASVNQDLCGPWSLCAAVSVGAEDFFPLININVKYHSTVTQL